MDTPGTPQAYFALVLHAHLPFVRHPELPRFMEEDWLFEAITETYLPLLDTFEGLDRDGVDFRVTMSLTPPLISMLTDELLQERYEQYLDSRIELAGAIAELRTSREPVMVVVEAFAAGQKRNRL